MPFVGEQKDLMPNLRPGQIPDGRVGVFWPDVGICQPVYNQDVPPYVVYKPARGGIGVLLGKLLGCAAHHLFGIGSAMGLSLIHI